MRGQPATGTYAGARRHRRAGESNCPPCQDAERAFHREWKADNPEQQAAWARANPTRRRASGRRSYWRNRERERERSRKWYAQPGRERLKSQRRRARRLAVATIPFTPDQLDQRMSMFGKRCWLCGGPFEQVDHVKPVSKGGPHMLANLRPACNRCNARKKDRWPLGLSA